MAFIYISLLLSSSKLDYRCESNTLKQFWPYAPEPGEEMGV